MSFQPSPPHLILCVDDETVGLQVRRILLERAGYRVLTAPDGPSGLELFSREPVEAVVLDFSMPGMTGGEVALNMRKRKPNVPILMLSAYVSLPQEVTDSVNLYMTKGEGAPALLKNLSSLVPGLAPEARWAPPDACVRPVVLQPLYPQAVPLNSASFDRMLRQVVIIPLGTLLLCIAALFYQMHTANEMLAAVHLADQRIRQTTELQSLITDEESGVRGYQITRDPAFLEPYSRAKAQLPDAFGRRREASVLAGRAALIDDLQTAHDQWQQNFAESVIAGVQAGSQTSDVELNLQGKRQIDAIRQRIIHINTLTEQGRDVLNDRWRRQVRRTFVSAGVVAVLIGLFFGFYMRHLLKDVSVAFRQSHNVLRLRAEQAFRSEQRLRTTLQSIGDAVITCDPEGRIDSMNPVAEQLTGWAQQEAQDQPLEKVFQIVDETTREPLENPVSKVKRLNNVVGLKSHTLLLQKGGTEILIDNSGAPIRDKDGLMEGVVLVFRDVTMARRSQQALIANEKLAVAGRLAATIAHEIHNPLDSVSNLLFLMDGQSTEEESAQFLQMAKAEIARVTQISRAMLSLYRESRAPVAIDVKETLESVLLLMERRFQTLGVTVTADLPENLLIFGFPAEMRQVFTNLLSNAAEAAGVQASVEVSARACVKRVDADGLHREAGVEVTIQDHGAGIPESVLDKLFQPFFTTKGEQGTGLGLWVSRGIVTKHGGSLELTSSTAEEDHGTRATVFLTSEVVTHSAGG